MRPLKPGDALLVHFDAVQYVSILCKDDLRMNSPISFAWVAGDVVAAVLVDAAWIQEVLVEMVNKFKDVALH